MIENNKEVYDYLLHKATATVNKFPDQLFDELTFKQNPVEFIEAPEDVPLLVVGDCLINAGKIDALIPIYRRLVRGSVIIKLSEKSINNNSDKIYLNTSAFDEALKEEIEGLIYCPLVFFNRQEGEGINTVETQKEFVGSYKKGNGGYIKATGEVMPISEVFFNGGKPFIDAESLYYMQKSFEDVTTKVSTNPLD